MQRNKPTVQDYSTYTPEDFYVWRLLYERQLPFVQANASRLYLDALEKIGFSANEIPHFDNTSKRLQQHTGWQLVVVPELVPQKDFFEMLTKKTFPATCWLRTLEELDYIEEPDMFHDVFGHVPLLVNSAYATFMQHFGELAMKWIDMPDAIPVLARVYWFTIEFGLLQESGKNKIFGAGIISSIGETAHVYTNESQKVPFNIREMLTTEYRIDTLQPRYFVIDSFEQLCNAIPQIDQQLEIILSASLMH